MADTISDPITQNIGLYLKPGCQYYLITLSDIKQYTTEFNEIIYKDFRSIFGHKVGEIPEGKKKPSLEIWIKKEVEDLRYAGFGKTIVFTDMHT